MAAPDAEIQTLIKRLALGTRSGKVRWQEEDSTYFSVTTNAGTAVVWSVDGDGEHPYGFEFRNSHHVVLARAVTTAGDFYTDWESDIEDLFKAARNTALGLDRSLSDFSSALDLPELPPPPPDDDIPF